MQHGDLRGGKVETGRRCSWPVVWVIAGDLGMGLAFPKANRLETTDVGRMCRGLLKPGSVGRGLAGGTIEEVTLLAKECGWSAGGCGWSGGGCG